VRPAGQYINMINPNWISLNYENKSGDIFLDDKRIGDFLVKEMGAVYLNKIKTPIGTYYRYSVNDLAKAYHSINLTYRYILW
jgi:hypothetical protein